MKLHDGAWALAVESVIGGLMSAYCVDNKQDQDVLNKLMDEVIGPGDRKPTIVNSKFIERVRLLLFLCHHTYVEWCCEKCTRRFRHYVTT